MLICFVIKKILFSFNLGYLNYFLIISSFNFVSDIKILIKLDMSKQGSIRDAKKVVRVLFNSLITLIGILFFVCF